MRQFKPKLKVTIISFLSPLHNKKTELNTRCSVRFFYLIKKRLPNITVAVHFRNKKIILGIILNTDLPCKNFFTPSRSLQADIFRRLNQIAQWH